MISDGPGGYTPYIRMIGMIGMIRIFRDQSLFITWGGSEEFRGAH